MPARRFVLLAHAVEVGLFGEREYGAGGTFASAVPAPAATTRRWCCGRGTAETRYWGSCVGTGGKHSTTVEGGWGVGVRRSGYNIEQTFFSHPPTYTPTPTPTTAKYHPPSLSSFTLWPITPTHLHPSPLCGRHLRLEAAQGLAVLPARALLQRWRGARGGGGGTATCRAPPRPPPRRTARHSPTASSTAAATEPFWGAARSDRRGARRPTTVAVAALAAVNRGVPSAGPSTPAYQTYCAWRCTPRAHCSCSHLLLRCKLRPPDL